MLSFISSIYSFLCPSWCGCARTDWGGRAADWTDLLIAVGVSSASIDLTDTVIISAEKDDHICLLDSSVCL